MSEEREKLIEKYLGEVDPVIRHAIALEFALTELTEEDMKRILNKKRTFLDFIDVESVPQGVKCPLPKLK